MEIGSQHSHILLRLQLYAIQEKAKQKKKKKNYTFWRQLQIPLATEAKCYTAAQNAIQGRVCSESHSGTNIYQRIEPSLCA